MRFAWLSRCGTCCAVGVLLILSNFVSGNAIAQAAPGSARTRSPKLQHKTTKVVSQARRAKGRWIEVDLRRQRLIAWEGGRRVYTARISSGKRATPTRRGTFYIRSKHRSARMRGRDYNVPNVPYTMYYSGGYAIHGAYWHRRFGTPVSHGCVNLPVGHARRLYNWARVGTRVVVR